jgi:hypothetical protein
MKSYSFTPSPIVTLIQWHRKKFGPISNPKTVTSYMYDPLGVIQIIHDTFLALF